MITTIGINRYSELMADTELAEIFDCMGNDNSINLDLWALSIVKTGYGHWKVTVSLEIDGNKLAVSHTTTDSQSIDNFRSEDCDEEGRAIEGFSSLLRQVLRAESDTICNFIDTL